MFSKILIANRGEIACRIIRTARHLGIATAAVYSEADRNAMHVALADEAFFIGPAPARESYLHGEKILEAAQRCGAEAIHPGYGFLSENAAFADACANAGLIFIGPPASVIRAMGDKAQAKSLMEKAGVPLVPGYHGDEQDPVILAQEAEKIGYPLLVKPLAGGGGKGMKIVTSAEVLAPAIESAKREAQAAFGDDRVLLEKHIWPSRHVEVQIFADTHGNFVHLFNRDCSIQRRHQKIIEEAPAPGLSGALRGAMQEAALAAARAAAYVSAGTVEFLLSPQNGAFYFLEMNTRLQVEHPVTEMITGIDLVEWQIYVAAGSALPLRQDEIISRGAAIEARLYAEDPARDFLPQAGQIAHLHFPEAGPHVRIDTGVRGGDTIPVDYDPMIAKVIVWGEDRGWAISRLRPVLDKIRAGGLATNIDLLRAIAGHDDFDAALLDTGFLEHHSDVLLVPPKPPGGEILAMVVIGLLCEREAIARRQAALSGDPWSPWSRQTGWRLNGAARETLHLRETKAGCGGASHAIVVTYLREGWRLELPDFFVACAKGSLAPDSSLTAELDGHMSKAVFIRAGQDVLVFPGAGGAGHRFALASPGLAPARDAIMPGRLVAPMPGRIVALLAEPGSRVAAGQPVLILEAMKMEHLLSAPQSGVVKEYTFKPGSQVAEGVELVIFEAAPPVENKA